MGEQDQEDNIFFPQITKEDFQKSKRDSSESKWLHQTSLQIEYSMIISLWQLQKKKKKQQHSYGLDFNFESFN